MKINTLESPKVKKLVIITAQPQDILYCWQVRVQCQNFREQGLSGSYRVLVFIEKNQKVKPEWKQLEKDYPEVRFYYYLDNQDLVSTQFDPIGYPSLVRPYLLANHFYEFPMLKDNAVFYCDSDILFTKKLPFEKYIEDDICYLSDCQYYIGSSYWDSKIKDVIKGKEEEYLKLDPLKYCANLVKIDKSIIVDNNINSGGAQYLLKNISYDFWVNVYADTIKIFKALNYQHKNSINSRFFESENKGFQSWCADMWGLLWNLWKRGYKTECPKDFDFAWATSHISVLEDKYIYHDAGIDQYQWSKSEYPNKLFWKHEFRDKFPNINSLDYKSGFSCEWYAEQVEKSLLNYNNNLK